MGITREAISAWIKEGRALGMQYLIVACDTFDYEDYPIFCKDAQECEKKYKEHDGLNMQRVMEVYNLTKQIDENRTARTLDLPWRTA